MDLLRKALREQDPDARHRAIMPEMSSTFARPTRSPVRYEAICSMPERIITAPKP